jgi:hypothetical protein
MHLLKRPGIAVPGRFVFYRVISAWVNAPPKKESPPVMKSEGKNRFAFFRSASRSRCMLSLKLA